MQQPSEESRPKGSPSADGPATAGPPSGGRAPAGPAAAGPAGAGPSGGHPTGAGLAGAGPAGGHPTGAGPAGVHARHALPDGSLTAQPPPKPLDPPMVPFAIAGIAIWALATLLVLPFQRRLEDSGHGSWLWICVAGILWGLVGLAVMLRHDANRRRRRGDDE